MKIAFVGMTHLGIVSAVAAAVKGFSVTCFDPSASLVASLKRCAPGIEEPNLIDNMRTYAQNLTFTEELSALAACELVYVAPDIATNDQGSSDLTALQRLLHLILPACHPEATLVILSQVTPGFTRTVAWPKEQLFYQVETLIFGEAMQRALYPERLIVGCHKTPCTLPEAFQNFLGAFAVPILTMSYESAELAKIAINLFLVSTLSTTNSLAALCEKMGATWSDIATCLRLDKRIGPHAYLTPGLGISGGNLERDMHTFASLAARYGTDFRLIEACQHLSRQRKDWILNVLHTYVFPQHSHPTLAILGLAYKADTASIKNSPALALLSHLHHLPRRAFDPLVMTLPDAIGGVEIMPSAEEAYRDADVLLLMTPWRAFRTLSLQDLADNVRTKIVIDPYQLLDYSACKAAGLTCYHMGTTLPEKIYDAV